LGNSCDNFQLHKFTISENIAKSFRGATFFDSHCIYILLLLTVREVTYKYIISVVSVCLSVCLSVSLSDDKFWNPRWVTWQRWWSHHSICHTQNPMLHANLMALMFYRTAVIADQSFTLRE